MRHYGNVLKKGEEEEDYRLLVGNDVPKPS